MGLWGACPTFHDDEMQREASMKGFWAKVGPSKAPGSPNMDNDTDEQESEVAHVWVLVPFEHDVTQTNATRLHSGTGVTRTLVVSTMT